MVIMPLSEWIFSTFFPNLDFWTTPKINYAMKGQPLLLLLLHDQKGNRWMCLEHKTKVVLFTFTSSKCQSP